MRNVKKPSPTKSYGKIRKVQNITLVNINKINSKLKEINLPKQRPSTVEIYFINLYLLNLIQNPQQNMIKSLFQPPTRKIRAVLRKIIRSPTILNLTNLVNLTSLSIIKDPLMIIIIWNLIRSVYNSRNILQILI